MRPTTRVARPRRWARKAVVLAALAVLAAAAAAAALWAPGWNRVFGGQAGLDPAPRIRGSNQNPAPVHGAHPAPDPNPDPAPDPEPPRGGPARALAVDVAKGAIGDLAEEFGQNLVFDENDGRRVLRGTNEDGRVQWEGFALEAPCEILLELKSSSLDYRFEARQGSRSLFAFLAKGSMLTFAEERRAYHKAGWLPRQWNRLRISVADGAAKCFLNDAYFATQPIRGAGPAGVASTLTIDQIILEGLGTRDALAQLTATPAAPGRPDTE
jgi:hypothetical protein